VNELLGRQIDVLYSCTLPGDSGSILRWCQGEVIEIQADKSQRFVFSGIQCQMSKDHKNHPSRMQFSYQANGKKKQRVDGEWMLILVFKMNLMMQMTQRK
jgi:hypothetical protein